MKQHNEIKELIEKMTLEEKVRQLCCCIPLLCTNGELVDENKLEKWATKDGIGRMTQYASAFVSGPRMAARANNEIQKYHKEKTRLGIPVLFQNESAAGLVAAGATIFPVPIAMASTFEPELLEKMGKVVSEQANAIGVKKCLSPVADVARDARWGRVGETFGEDVTLVTAMSLAQAKGLQQENYGDHVISCAKHFMGYGASENGINCAEINLGKKQLREVYGTPFAAMIKETDLQSVMVTYSEIDGHPMSINKEYMQDYLRDELGFTGSAICDANSIPGCHEENGIGNDNLDVAILAAKVGIDADTPVTQIYMKLIDAIKDGRLEEKYIDEMVSRVLNQKYELGLFDNPYVDEDKAEEVFNKPEGNLLSKEMSEKEITLLKNNNELLPLKDKYKNIALIGPFAHRLSTLFGGYAYPSFLEMLISAVYNIDAPMEGGFAAYFRQLMNAREMHKALGVDDSITYEENVENILRNKYKLETLKDNMEKVFSSNISYAKGYGVIDEFDKDLKEAVEVAKNSEVIVLCLGEITGFGKDATSGEGINNPDLRLPGKQAELVSELAKLNKPIVLVLFNGRALELNGVEDKVDSILEVWYPGPFGGQAIAKVLHGDINPGGKLPVSFPKISAQCPVYYAHHARSGYRSLRNDMPGMNNVLTPLYPFGHGLSYTKFKYDNLKVSDKVTMDGKVSVNFDVTNVGEVKGDEVPQVYFRTINPSITRPVRELKAFKRITLEPKETKHLEFEISAHALGYYNIEDKFVLEPTLNEVYVGSSSDDTPLTGKFELVGEVTDILKQRDFLFAVKD